MSRRRIDPNESIVAVCFDYLNGFLRVDEQEHVDYSASYLRYRGYLIDVVIPWSAIDEMLLWVYISNKRIRYRKIFIILKLIGANLELVTEFELWKQLKP